MSIPSRTSGPAKVAGGAVGILGLWGALVPFAGPSFGYSMGGVPAWTWTESHLTLHLLPGIAAILGAALLIRGSRAIQKFGALVAVLGGVWFVVAPSLHPLWAGQSMSGGMSDMGGSAWSSALSGLGYHYGTGAVITVIAAYAWGALSATQETPAGIPASDASHADRQDARDSSPVGARS